MTNTEKIIFNEDVDIYPIDTCIEENSMILEYKGKRWIIKEELLLLALSIDGERTLEDIYLIISKNYNSLNYDDIKKIFTNFFIKNNLVINDSNEDIRKNKNSSLWLKKRILSKNAVLRLTFPQLFYRKFMIFAILLFLILFTYFLYINQFVLPIMIVKGNDFLILGILLLLEAVIHELGHSSACVIKGETPDEIGIAMYIHMPVLYSNVNNSWKLSRKDRLLIDFGGIYSQMLFIIVMLILYFIYRNELIASCVGISIISLFLNLNPLVKMDGYWIVSDYLGIPNFWDYSLRLLFASKANKPTIVVSKKHYIYLYIIFFLSNLFLLPLIIFNSGKEAVILVNNLISVFNLVVFFNLFIHIIIIISVFRMVVLIILKIITIRRR